MEEKEVQINFHSIISSMQKIALYDTKTYFYLIGSNNTQTRFRILKIKRSDPKELIVIDDKIEYTQEEIRELVKMIDMKNRSRSSQRGSANGMSKTVSAFGIIGFIRFLEGYYVILVTKRRKIAVIGHHTIYKIEDTSMIYIPNDTVRVFHPDEQRYVKMFQSIDLSSNFYFSYSYDLTHTLQNNKAPPKHIINELMNKIDCGLTGDFEDDKNFVNMWAAKNWQENTEKILHYGIRNNPNRRFVWNSHLLSPVEKDLHPDWVLYIIHGFIGQSNLSIFGRSMYVTLIARRSNRYAGTRFLKRGANFEGDVANEVETEQIVHDLGISALYPGRFSSFVQMRGSVPGHWSQDISKMVPKPMISVDLCEPYIETAGAHFNQLLKRYGSPIIILNLVKKREKKKHESTLSEEMSTSVKYLNQFLPPEHNIQYISFDMARKNKGREANVMQRLASIANNAILKTGIFQSPDFCCNKNQVPGVKKFSKIDPNSSSLNLTDSLKDDSMKSSTGSYNFNFLNDKISRDFRKKGTLQSGIIRTNCVDCLDRTNTAQFAIGKCALGYQLFSLGILRFPKLEFDSDCVRMLEELYEDHGDTLALQYGGSQLVHRIKTYRKTAPWTSQGNDIMQTLSRYYSNTFSDQEKQHTINLFLGLFIPEEGKPPIWESLTDYYLHHKMACKYSSKTRALTQWWNTNIPKCFPYALSEVTKSCSEMIQLQDTSKEMIDIYYDYYKPYELSVLSEVYAYTVSHSVRDFMPHFTIEYSPFVVRVRPGKRREETGNKNSNMKNPSLTGQSSTGSTASSASSSCSSSDDEESRDMTDQLMTLSKNDSEKLSFDALFPSMSQVYGIQPTCPRRSDLILYKKFVLIGKSASSRLDSLKLGSKLSGESSFSNAKQKQLNIEAPNTNVSVYEQYLKKTENGGFMPNPSDMNLYERYAHQQQLQLGSLHPDLQ